MTAKCPVADCDIPSFSLLDRRLIEAAWFRDAYRARLQQPQAGSVLKVTEAAAAARGPGGEIVMNATSLRASIVDRPA